jgi:hypothetical protein
MPKHREWHIFSYIQINKYLELPVAMRNLWSLEKKSILPLIQGDRRKTFNAVSYLFFMRFE